jgi:hypothetical protein
MVLESGVWGSLRLGLREHLHFILVNLMSELAVIIKTDAQHIATTTSFHVGL